MINNNYLIPIINFSNIIIERAKGSYLYDTNGKKYLDLNSGQFCTVLGHSNDDIVSNINSDNSNIIHTATNILSKTVLEASENLYRISEEMKGYSIILSTGAEVVEFCLRYAKKIKRKNGIICFNKGYHGLTLGAQSVTFGGKYSLPSVTDIYSLDIDSPENIKNSIERVCLKLEELLKANNDNIAAVIFEPIVSVGGMVFFTKEFWAEVRRLCIKYDILLILDECQTGFGRTGNWFAYQTYGFVPDMIACAKAVGLGYPVSIAMFNERIIKRDGFGITHYSSHQNDAFAANIINSGIKFIEGANILLDVNNKGEYFLSKLKSLESKNKYFINARGKGLMLGIDLYFDSISDYRSIYNYLYALMIEKGLIIQGTDGGHVLRFLPDYLISLENIDFAIDALDEGINQIANSKAGGKFI
ncbi:MAG: aspartate aminotransferase family protein [Eubacterium sp.]|jgi:4-aminobutyrate aminotransferase-like enzyme|nr:aspartate aminotransferase family protein [Eubacterium sp.]